METAQLTAAVAHAPARSNFGTRPLSPALGAEITGIDLRDEIDEQLSQRLLDTWHQYLVIVLRDQILDEDNQVRFAEHFGPLAKVSSKKQFSRKHPAVMLISNIRENGEPIGNLPDGEMQFHTDQCHQPRPAKASMLYAIEIPSTGGNTLFANAYAAYETLPDDVKRRLEGRRALNAYDYDIGTTIRRSEVPDDTPSQWHPAVRTHPATGRKALYVNRLMTRKIEGLPAQESDELLNFLFDHQERPQFIYEHVWRPGDILVWDNRCTLHARTDFSPTERRLMRRVTILGEVPV
jgi:alpha-ketoglutarate-dependent taurine dioxygenase